MKADVLSEDFIPSRLVRREDMLDKVVDMMNKHSVVVIEGVSGVGKTTLVRMLERKMGRQVSFIYVDCSMCRTYPGILSRIGEVIGVRRSVLDALLSRSKSVIVLDDFTLVVNRQTIRFIERIKKKHKVILVVHPWVSLPLSSFGKVSMPPYSREELIDIITDRVLSGNLSRVSDEAVERVSYALGFPRGPGSARLALLVLREAIKLTDGEVLTTHVDKVMEILGLY